MKKLLYIFLGLSLMFGCSDDSSDDNTNPLDDTNPVYLDDNGVTIKAKDWSVVGDQGVINGVTYTVVDETMLREMVANEEDLTALATTKVTDMGDLRDYELNYNVTTDFNQPIGNWDTSNVTNMLRLFMNYTSFNQDISFWDVSNVTNMGNLFTYCAEFNQPIGNWDTSNVTNMAATFAETSFNQDISNWDVSSVNRMDSMFEGAVSFNQPIGNWNVENVLRITSMFNGAVSFNQPLNDWDVSGLIHNSDMWAVFKNASSFNQDISSWDVSNIQNMQEMFKNASSFNQNLSSWSVDNVTMCYDFSVDSLTDSAMTSWTLPQPNFTNCNPN